MLDPLITGGDSGRYEKNDGVQGAGWSARWESGNRQGAPLVNESPVPDEDAATLCFNEVTSVRSNGCDCSIDVPYLGGGVLHCNMVPDLKVGQGVGMLIIEGLGCFRCVYNG